jgi:hypothetical protein
MYEVHILQSVSLIQLSILLGGFVESPRRFGMKCINT